MLEMRKKQLFLDIPIRIENRFFSFYVLALQKIHINIETVQTDSFNFLEHTNFWI